ncbi:MAG: ABC transporter permease, partial [Deltaproteobacteria bacterium]|nr:ABC transporter permease [Deltaproteobacteria bacterium]
MKDLAVVWVAAKRTWIKTLRWPGTLTFSFVQPLMWIVFFGFLMQKFELRGLPAGISYRDFLLPGICAMTVLFGASQMGASYIRDLQSGFLQRMVTTPAPRWAMHLGKIFGDTTRLMAQAIVLLIVGRILGMH